MTIEEIADLHGISRNHLMKVVPEPAPRDGALPMSFHPKEAQAA